MQGQRVQFSADVSRRGRTASVTLHGEFDVLAEDALTQLTSVLIARFERVDVDLSDVTFIDFTAMRVLIAAMAGASAAGVRLRLHAMPAQVRRVFDLSVSVAAPVRLPRAA